MHEAAYYLLMNDKNIEGIAVGFYPTMDRVKRFDFTASAWSEGFSFVVPRPEEESRLFAFIGPFQPLVWMSIFISLFFVIATMTVFTWIYNYRFTNTTNGRKMESNMKSDHDESHSKSIFTFIGSHMIYVINTMTNQGGSEFSSRTSFRVLAGAWVLCAMVLVNSYTGIVTSSLTTPKMKPPINTMEDLAASQEVNIVLRSDTSTGIQILQATSGIFKVLGDQVRSKPDRLFTDPFKIAAKLETGHFAFPYVHTFSVAFVASQYKKDGKCRFRLSKMLPLSHGHYPFLYKKGSRYTKTISKGVLELCETGLIRFWTNNLPTIPKADECFAENKRRVSRPVPIQLTDLISAFLILGIGLGLATLIFLLEKIHSKWQRFKRR
ncbi:glutamate receptor 3-like [Daphnia pulex]|uniref:glutamate receptor 3-like n=1 Tax=Daphnia pulex TaxID=6669 RepID=UPI001EDE2EAA|nr:glutamate receptor 3-like [Daphnia pulex]